MTQQTISIRTLRTFTYRPLTPSPSTTSSACTSSTSSPIERASPLPTSFKGSKPTSAISRKSRPRRSARNMAWPSKQCKQQQQKSTTSTAALSAGLESYLLLLEQQRDAVASRCSSVAGSEYSREDTPESVAE